MKGIKNIAFIVKDLAAYSTHVKPLFDSYSNKEFSFFILYINNSNNSFVTPFDSAAKFVEINLKKNITQILLNQHINFCVSLNPGNIFDLFIISISKLNNIPTAYYQHGIQLDFTTFNPQTLFQNSSILKKTNSLKKYLFYYLFFALNILKSQKKIFLLRTVLIKTKHLLDKKNIKYLPKYGLKENHIDYAFMYGQKDKEYLISSMNMDSSNIYITGYPFPAYQKYAVSNMRILNSETKTALYLSTALRTVGVIPITIDEEKEFYLEVYNQAKKSGFKLIIKLHPCEDEELFNSYFENIDVKIIRLANLSDLVHEVDLVIGEYTTTFFYAIREFKQIIIINSPYFKDYPFDFTKYGVGIKTDLNNLSATLNKNISLSKKNILSYKMFTKNFINHNKNISSYDLFFKFVNNILDLNNK